MGCDNSKTLIPQVKLPRHNNSVKCVPPGLIVRAIHAVQCGTEFCLIHEVKLKFETKWRRSKMEALNNQQQQDPRLLAKFEDYITSELVAFPPLAGPCHKIILDGHLMNFVQCNVFFTSMIDIQYMTFFASFGNFKNRIIICIAQFAITWCTLVSNRQRGLMRFLLSKIT